MLKKIVAMIGAIALMAGTVVSAIAEGIREPAFPSVTTEDGYTVEISKAYYNDNSVFVWYKLSGDITYTELHEGAPDENIQWKHVFEDTIAAEKWSNDSPLLQQALEWLDGQGQRWTFCQIARLLDGLELEDGSYADMIAGEEEYLEDGSISGWRECKIPEGKNSDSMTFKLVLSRSESTWFQDGTTNKQLNVPMERTDILITLTKGNQDPQGIELSSSDRDDE